MSLREAIEDDRLASLDWIPLRHERHTVVSSDRLHGQSLNALGWIDFGDVWLGNRDQQPGTQ